ncbi:MAG: hypothetical protein ACRD2U_05300 [Terriglobales bacterium]
MSDNPLDFVFFRADPMSFIPVNFCLAYRTIGKFDVSYAFQFPPTTLAIGFPQSLAFSDPSTGGEGLHV